MKPYRPKVEHFDVAAPADLAECGATNLAYLAIEFHLRDDEDDPRIGWVLDAANGRGAMFMQDFSAEVGRLWDGHYYRRLRRTLAAVAAEVAEGRRGG